MIFEYPEGGTPTIWFRQSWLSDYLTCPERGRAKAFDNLPEQTPNDAAMCGTAVHSAIEQVLNDHEKAPYIGAIARHEMYELADREQVRHHHFANVQEMAEQAAKNAGCWVRDIYPQVPRGGLTEVEFKFPYFEYRGYMIGLTGTVDYVHPDGLWDWKNPGRKYYENSKQKYDIQSTVYSVAATSDQLGYINFSYPMTMTFGVIVRAAKPSAQVFTVRRTASHEYWLRRHLKMAVDLSMDIGEESNWPTNDDNFLCSARWCDNYNFCRGAFLSAADDARG
jgi:hypothetical protein